MGDANAKPRRVVVTGIGVVSPVGIGIEAFWSSLAAGRSAIGPRRSSAESSAQSDVPSKLAAEVADFDVRPFLRQKKMLKVMSRDIQLGVSAASLAMHTAGLRRGSVDPERLGVVFGTGQIPWTPEELVEAAAHCAGDHPFDFFDFDRWGREGISQIYPLWLLRQLPNMPACHVAIDYDARGPNNTITSREASPLLALAEAVHVIRRQRADVMIVGACGSDLHALDIARLNLTESLSKQEDPERACRPFDRDRDGCVLGEGAAAFVIEDYDRAHARGAEMFGEILATTAGCDGKGYLNGAGGTGLVRAIEAAFRQAGVDPREIGHINAHGKATRRDDIVETRAYHRVFGDLADRVPVTALKSYFGAFDAGAGAVELAGSLLALRHGRIPATLRYHTPDPQCRLNVVHGDALPLTNGTFLKVNRTAMGQSAAAIVRSV
jgi:3-oxoacyl-[acyl-carrier-protein] synthase II